MVCDARTSRTCDVRPGIAPIVGPPFGDGQAAVNQLLKFRRHLDGLHRKWKALKSEKGLQWERVERSPSGAQTSSRRVNTGTIRSSKLELAERPLPIFPEQSASP